MSRLTNASRVLGPFLFSALLVTAPVALLAQSTHTITGQDAFTDYSKQKPGTMRKITVADLPVPYATQSVDNGPGVVPRPEGAMPEAPAGFKVELYSSDVKNPRLIRTAPNGDLFVVESEPDRSGDSGTIKIFRGALPDGKANESSTFATGLKQPFGLAFYPLGPNPKWIYVGNTDSVVRFPYKNGQLTAKGKPEVVVPDLPGGGRLRGGGHWTRDVVFTADGQHLLVSVGSGSNVDDADTHPKEFHRADVLEYTPDGKFVEVYAHGIRNCVGEAINPITGQLWCSTNERDNLGNHLVPDYVTSVPEGSFFGWPWYYMGGHQDPRLPQPCANGTGPNPQAPVLTADQAKNCKRLDLSSKVVTPDVLVQPHMASLEMLFYPAHTRADSFPAEYAGDVYAAEHGSWNRKNRAGYEVIHIPMKNGHATGEYDDFLTGFVTANGDVWGRPVGVAVGNDGSLFVTDDGSRSVWHVVYTGK